MIFLITPEDQINLIDLQKEQRLFLVPFKLHHGNKKTSMRALLNSGANGTFINPDTIDKYKLKKFPL